MRWRTSVPTAVALAGLATFAYAAAYERRRWTLRRYELPLLPAGAAPLTVLHLSDLHMMPGQRSKQEWVASLAGLGADFVALTGDNLSSPDAVPTVLDALGPLLARPGAFVFGSNDYFGPVPKNPFVYFDRHHAKRTGAALPWTDLRDALLTAGWSDLTNARTTMKVGDRVVELAGVDDPHLDQDDYTAIAGPVHPTAQLHLGLTHAPEPRVLDEFAADGFELVLAGHTHGGQVRLPFYGALVTNCGIDRSRARGAHRWSGDTWLHVSAGLGTSPYAPVRFACPPEASLLTLVPAPAAADQDPFVRGATGVG